MKKITTSIKSNVRKIFLALVSIQFAGPTPLHAQELRNAISIDLFLPAMSPVSYLVGEESRLIPINIKYKRLLTEHQMLMVKMGFNYNWDAGGNESVDVYPMVALDWHPYNDDMQGFYLGPSLFFNYSNYSYSGTTKARDIDHSYWLAIGGNMGYEFVLKPNVIVDITFGLGYGYSKETELTGMINSGFRVDETIGGIFVGCNF